MSTLLAGMLCRKMKQECQPGQRAGEAKERRQVLEMWQPLSPKDESAGR